MHKNLHILDLLILSVTVLEHPFVTIIAIELIEKSHPLIHKNI
jgi:hypothetical protein